MSTSKTLTADCNSVVRYEHDPQVEMLLKRFGLELIATEDAKIPGSYWGDDEAGLIDHGLYARSDTPMHSVLHEACHFICMDSERRSMLHTNAGGDELEECAVCYLSVILSDELDRLGRHRMLLDMDRWGYSFRLGGACQWFETDAEDAKQFLLKHELIDSADCPTYSVRR